MFKSFYVLLFLFSGYSLATEVSICYYSKNNDYSCKPINEEEESSKPDNTFYEYQGDGTLLKYSEFGSVANTSSYVPSRSYKKKQFDFQSDYGQQDEDDE